MKSEIQRVENALTHAISYIKHAPDFDKLSLYESRLSLIIARNHELFMRMKASRPQRVNKPEPATVTEMRVRTAGAMAIAADRQETIPKSA